MHHRILVVGKPALAYAKSGIDDYLRRLQRMNQFGRCEFKIIKDGKAEEVSQRLLDASTGHYRIVLDERGITPTTRQLTERITKLRDRPDVKGISYLIGPANGHLSNTREAADLVLSLSSLVLQHELATLLLAEQLYRVASLQAGAPYHRD